MSDRDSPRFTRVNGPLMARWLDHAEGRSSAFQAGHIPSCYGSCECCALSPVVPACRWSLLSLSPLLSIRRGSSVVEIPDESLEAQVVEGNREFLDRPARGLCALSLSGQAARA